MRPRPGPRNCITDVEGVLVGHAALPAFTTGATVILGERPMVAAVDIRGGGPATRATEGLSPGGMVEAVDAIALSGGSSFGLDAAGGAADWLKTQGRGFAIGPVRVPIVAGAIIFDLLTGPDKSWEAPPFWALGREAAEAAGTGPRQAVALGNAGAGLGAKAGSLKGGVGTASYVTDLGSVGALAVANPVGSVVMPGTRTFWGWWLEEAGELGGQAPPAAAPQTLDHAFPGEIGANTTLGVVATDATLTREQALRLAVMAQDGLARAIRPVHTPFDGDTVFAVSTGTRPLADPIAGIARLGMLAADCLARAVMRGVHEADALAGWPGYRDGGAGGR